MTGPEPTSPSVLDRRLPPVAQLTVASLILMFSSGVYLAAHLPRQPPLGPVIGLLIGGSVLTVAAMALLSRIQPFAWGTFFLVVRWALLAYVVLSAVGAFVFLYDHTRGSTLAVLLCTLVVFAIDVPTVIAFTVARYEQTTRQLGS
jgi:hypothetical protein